MTLDDVRTAFAAGLRERHGLRSPHVVAALGSVPRERFLGPGPWTVAAGPGLAPQATPSGDPRLVYQDVSIALDASRQLYNGQPGLVATWLDELALSPGEAVLHVGCATGYYSAVIAHVVGSIGRVVAVEVDDELCRRAATNLDPWPWVEVRQDDGRARQSDRFDAVLIHAGATHVETSWLDALADGGLLLVPLTATMPGMPATLSKGLVLVVSRRGEEFAARLNGLVMIYTLANLRDEAANARLGRALRSGQSETVTRVRRDRHDEGAGCWLHGDAVCLSR
jgi:protein-L-isoaspartate(D-aspartate) O-methyltransferase